MLPPRMGRQILVTIASAVILLLCAHETSTYPNGAPESQCRSMAPQHASSAAQTSASPYTITLDKTSVKGGEAVHVTLTSPSQDVPFAGFLAMGQKSGSNYNAETTNAFGTMRLPVLPSGDRASAQTLRCHNIKDSALTHVTKNPKAKVEFDWIAPNEDGEFVILATFIQSFTTFWGKQPSEKIRVTKDSGLQETQQSDSKQEQAQLSPAVKAKFTEFYQGCGTTKGCFGLPGGCVSGETCQSLVTFANVGGRHVFQLAGELSDGVGYVATGLSFDTSMAKSSIIACVVSGESVIINSFYSPSPGRVIRSINDDVYTEPNGSYEDGVVLCEFTRKAFLSESDGTDFDLNTMKFHFLLATNGGGDAENLTYHGFGPDNRLAGKQMVMLHETVIIDEETGPEPTTMEPVSEQTTVESEPQPTPSPIEGDLDQLLERFYGDCGVTKGCFGLPTGCVSNRDCSVFTSFNADLKFQVSTIVDSNYNFGAVGLSLDLAMGQDVVTGCYFENGQTKVGSYYNAPNIKYNSGFLNEPFKGLVTSDSSTTHINGHIFCEFTREAIFDTPELQRVFNLNTDQYYILLARGPSATSSGLAYHPTASDRQSGSVPVLLSDTTIIDEGEGPTQDPIEGDLDQLRQRFYGECGERKGCFGLPSGCVSNRNCSVFTSFSADLKFQVSAIVDSAYNFGAVGLSLDSSMGQDIVTGCYFENGQAKVGSYYNAPNEKFNIGFPNEPLKGIITSDSSTTHINGHIFCEFTREAIFDTPELERVFNLNTDQYYILLARGPAATSSGLAPHPTASDRQSGSVPVLLSDTTIIDEGEGPTQDPIEGDLDQLRQRFYGECGERKGCFGLPSGCVSNRNCSVFTSFSADLKFQVSAIVDSAYNFGAVGLSFDSSMGQDIVTGCYFENGQAKVGSYYNAPNEQFNIGFPNEPLKGISDGSSATHIEGHIFCEFTREAIFDTPELQRVFTLNTDQYYILLARGPSATSTSLSYHTTVRDRQAGSVRVLLSETIIIDEDNEGPTQDPIEGDLDELFERFYGDCGETKGCFGLPNRCVQNRNCVVFATFTQNLTFQVLAKVESESEYNYGAVGLSFDDSMGQDLVTGCYFENGVAKVGTYYNEPNGKANKGFTNEPLKGIISGSNGGTYMDGYIFCEFTREEKFDATELGRAFNLNTDEYHILLSRGPYASSVVLGKHPQVSDRGASPDAVPLSYVGILGVKSNILVELHAGFMIMAWLLCASTGMFTARYYKQTHTDLNPFNKAFWFVLHISCMFTTVFLTICGIIFIFVEVGGYSESPTGAGSWHPILGLILLGLAVCQVLIAFFRPHPGTSKRPLFNWIHWTIGNSAHIVGIACIFLAEQLSKGGMTGNKAYLFVLVGFVVFHVVMHVIMSIHTVWADKQMDTHNRMRAVRPGPMKPSGKSDEAPGTGFRTAMLTLYLVGSAAVAITLVTLVANKLD